MKYKSKRGSMLVPAMIILFTVLFMGAALITMGLWSVQSSVNTADGSQAYYAAKSVADAITKEMFDTQGKTVDSDTFGSDMEKLFYSMNKGDKKTSSDVEINGKTGVSTDNADTNCKYTLTFECKGFFDLNDSTKEYATVTDDVRNNSTQVINLTVKCEVTVTDLSETGTTEATNSTRTITKQLKINRKTSVTGFYTLGVTSVEKINVSDGTVIGDLYINTSSNSLDLENFNVIDGNFFIRSSNKAISLNGVKVDDDKQVIAICDKGNIKFDNECSLGTLYAKIGAPNGKFEFQTVPSTTNFYVDNATTENALKTIPASIAYQKTDVEKEWDAYKTTCEANYTVPSLKVVDAKKNDVTITENSQIKNYNSAKTITINTGVDNTIWVALDDGAPGEIGNIVLTGTGKVNFVVYGKDSKSQEAEFTSITGTENCTLNIIYQGRGIVRINCAKVNAWEYKEDTTLMKKMNVLALNGTVEIAAGNRIWGSVIGDGLRFCVGSVVRTIPLEGVTQWWGDVSDLIKITSNGGSSTGVPNLKVTYDDSTTYVANPIN